MSFNCFHEKYSRILGSTSVARHAKRPPTQNEIDEKPKGIEARCGGDDAIASSDISREGCVGDYCGGVVGSRMKICCRRQTAVTASRPPPLAPDDACRTLRWAAQGNGNHKGESLAASWDGDRCCWRSAATMVARFDGSVTIHHSRDASSHLRGWRERGRRLLGRNSTPTVVQTDGIGIKKCLNVSASLF